MTGQTYHFALPFSSLLFCRGAAVEAEVSRGERLKHRKSRNLSEDCGPANPSRGRTKKCGAGGHFGLAKGRKDGQNGGVPQPENRQTERTVQYRFAVASLFERFSGEAFLFVPEGFSPTRQGTRSMNMDNETKEKAAALADEAKKKAAGIWSTCIGKISSLWNNGVKGKAICIVAALAIVGVIGVCVDGDEESGESSGGKSGATAGSKSFEVNAPVKSLCGFAIGATPDSVKHLFKEPEVRGRWVSGKLATKYRYFDYASLGFSPNPMTGTGQYLTSVTLEVKNRSGMENWHPEDYDEERENIVTQLEKKYEITFKERRSAGGYPEWDWKTDDNDRPSQSISLSFTFGPFNPELVFESSLFSANAVKAHKEKQRQSSKISADAGADQL